MKVLKEGGWKMPWSMEAMCPEKECGAKLLVEEGDVSAVDYASQDEFSASCAVCGANIKISAAALPLRVKREKLKRKKYASWD